MGIISGPFFPLDHENAIFFISIYILHHVSECNERFKLKEKDILLWIAYEDKIKITFKYGQEFRFERKMLLCILCALIIKQRKVFGIY